MGDLEIARREERRMRKRRRRKKIWKIRAEGGEGISRYGE